MIISKYLAVNILHETGIAQSVKWHTTSWTAEGLEFESR
jgi:hypothetical protein